MPDGEARELGVPRGKGEGRVGVARAAQEPSAPAGMSTVFLGERAYPPGKIAVKRLRPWLVRA